ncbi:tetratricopeptide repeat protein [Sinomicrobium sp.]
MQFKRLISLVAGCCVLSTATAQLSEVYTYTDKDYGKALELYHNKQYSAAQRIFEKVRSRTHDQELAANSAYYVASSAIRLQQTGAEKLMENFVENHPTSSKRNTAYIDAGDYYFARGQYPQALKWYNKTEEQELSTTEKESFNFKKGYALFAVKRPDEAKTYFNRVASSETYGDRAKYYLGYMAYEGDDYNEATVYFDQVSNNRELNKKLSYYQADMSFKGGKFEEAVRLAKEQLPKSNPAEISELNKIIGESYFNLEQYEAAIPYLQGYKGKKGKWNNTDFYQLGYAYYKQGDYEKAIGQFNRIIGGSDFVAQNAYYHLAECYLKENRKQQALNAFRNASEMDFNAEITEDATLNYAKLSYDIGNPYQSVPEVLHHFVEQYPNSEFRQEVETLLVDSYVTSKNYDAALELLEKSNSYGNAAVYQKVAFFRGVELFRDGEFEESASYFDKAIAKAEDEEYTARAIYWRAETAYQRNNYEEAAKYFEDFLGEPGAYRTPEFYKVAYQQGYVAFKQRDYEKAIGYFEKYTDSESSLEDRKRLNDAWVRLGDSYFATSKYWPAMEAYNSAIAMREGQEDYPSFQKAISYGLVDREEKKIESLNAFIRDFPDSGLRDDAIYELGNTYVGQNRLDDATEMYRRLVKEYPLSPFAAKSMLREGLVYYNDGSNEKALEKLLAVVDYFPNTSEALQAVSTAKMIYVDMGQVETYANWVRGLDFVEVTDAELDNATFASAERQYAQSKSEEATKGFETYLDKFPKGLHANEAHFYVAQSYDEREDITKAMSHYEKVVEGGRNEYTEQALVRLGQLYLDGKDYKKALPVLSRLEEEAGSPQHSLFAKSNLMKVQRELGNNTEAVTYAKALLEDGDTDVRVRRDAHTIIARSAVVAGDDPTAKSAYKALAETATGALAAEALYYDAYFKNKEGEYEASNEQVQKLAEEYSGYKEFGAKGLLVMAKNFYAMGDAFQATYILDNLISSFSDYPELVDEARTELNRIKAEEAKTNSSVNLNNN